MTMTTKRIVLVLLVVFSLPILLHVYQPILALGALGLFLGAIGLFLSPVILFAVLLVFVIRAWNR